MPVTIKTEKVVWFWVLLLFCRLLLVFFFFFKVFLFFFYILTSDVPNQETLLKRFICWFFFKCVSHASNRLPEGICSARIAGIFHNTTPQKLDRIKKSFIFKTGKIIYNLLPLKQNKPKTMQRPP